MDQPVDPLLSNVDIDINIDEDIILDTKLHLGKDLIFKQGHYAFDKNIGEFGGYKIPLE